MSGFTVSETSVDEKKECSYSDAFDYILWNLLHEYDKWLIEFNRKNRLRYRWNPIHFEIDLDDYYITPRTHQRLLNLKVSIQDIYDDSPNYITYAIEHPGYKIIKYLCDKTWSCGYDTLTYARELKRDFDDSAKEQGYNENS